MIQNRKKKKYCTMIRWNHGCKILFNRKWNFFFMKLCRKFIGRRIFIWNLLAAMVLIAYKSYLKLHMSKNYCSYKFYKETYQIYNILEANWIKKCIRLSSNFWSACEINLNCLQVNQTKKKRTIHNSNIYKSVNINSYCHRKYVILQ